MATENLDPKPFSVDSSGIELAGESMGEGAPIVLLHGITATRRYVVHGSKALARRGHEQISYDARAHGESDPAPEGSGYSHAELAADLERILAERGVERPVLAGHSMGCHTVATYALGHADEIAGAVLVGPVVIGVPPDEERLAGWARLADGLEEGGVDGFMRVYEEQLGVDPEWKERVLDFTRARMELHRRPQDLARAMREIARSLPFDGLEELESLDVPALVVASHDDADPGHPYAVAEAWAGRLPNAELISEERGDAPLAWQGGSLARAIADFCEQPEVRERHA